MLKLGNVFLQHVNVFFFFHSLSLWIDFFFLSPDCKNKNKKNKNKKKNPVTRLLSFIFVLFTFLLETIMFVMVTSNGKLHTVF